MYNVNLQDLKVAIKEKNVSDVREILNEMEPEELNKEVLKLAIKSKHPRIISMVSHKTDKKHFDTEIVNLAINTKSGKLAKHILDKADPKHFNKESLQKAIVSKSSEITNLVVLKTDKSFFDKEILEMSIDSKDASILRPITSQMNPIHFDKDILVKSMSLNEPLVANVIIQKTDSKYFDKEILNLLFDTKSYRISNDVVVKTNEKYFDKEILSKSIQSESSQIVNSVAQKTNQKHFDGDILKESIHTKLEDIVRVVAQRVDKKLINKEILKLAIDTHLGKIVYTLGKYSDKEIFDKEVLERALSTKTPDVVRAVVDYTTDKKLFSDYKEQIQKAILNAKDIRNLTAQILSRKDNESFDREMQELVVDIYLDVINDHFKKSSIPKDFPIKEFEKSIEDSRYFFSNPDAINFDSLNKANKFLIIPVYSYGHAFSAVVRKLEEDKFSVTFVNLGARPFERDRSGNQYKEFVYNKEDAIKVLKDHSYSIRLYYPKRAVDTRKAYQNFAKDAKEEYLLHLTSRDQKVGNCFLKNIEKGIRYALALGLSKTEDKSFDPNTLRVGIEGGGKYKVKFLKPIHKPGDKTNDLETVALRKDLIDALLKKFPEYEKVIMQEWTLYQKRKEKTNPIDHHEFSTESRRKNHFVTQRVFDRNPLYKPEEVTTSNIKERDFSLLKKMNVFANKENLNQRQRNEMVMGR
jgi:hypothetical protein